MPVCTLVTVTFALGIAAPAGSVIVPLTVPVMVWPMTACWVNRRIMAKTQRQMDRVRSFGGFCVQWLRFLVGGSRMMGSNGVSILKCVAIGHDRRIRCQDKDGRRPDYPAFPNHVSWRRVLSRIDRGFASPLQFSRSPLREIISNTETETRLDEDAISRLLPACRRFVCPRPNREY